MRKKRFLAIVTAIIFSISLAAPVAVSATEAEEAADLTDEEQEEGYHGRERDFCFLFHKYR